MSHEFCRDIIENSLPSLIYYHENLVILGELITNFLAGCDYKGVFDLEGLPPKNINF